MKGSERDGGEIQMNKKYALAFAGILLLIALLRIAAGIAGGEDVSGELRSLLRVLFRRLLN